MKDNHIFEQKAGEKAFLLCNGKKIDSIKDLHKELVDIGDDVFNHHVNNERNDFSAWIKHVFDQSELAENISRLNDKEDIRKELGKWIFGLIREKYKTKSSEKKQSSKLNKAKKIISVREKKPKKELGVEEYYEPVKFERKDLEGLENPKHMLSGVIDFIIGFVVGALAILLLIRVF